MENNQALSELYFKWICSIAIPDEAVQAQYYDTLYLLHNTPFRYTLTLDENRLSDGVDLRYHFSYACKIPLETIELNFDKNSCSVLEMMVALAKRCEDSLMSNPSYGDRTYKWFWIMFYNLGLTVYRRDNWNNETEEIVKHIIDNFLNRTYPPYGFGNLFDLSDPKYDCRHIEIWDQMCLYMSKLILSDNTI